MKASLYPSFLLYLSFIFQIKSPTSIALPCKLFPKILGGTQGNTHPRTIDANLANDIIVLTGETYDNGLAGYNLNGGYQTYVASFSISSTRIYWAKADTFKMSTHTSLSISLSPNAKYVVVYLQITA
jgi:hypothetical protein